MTDMFGNPTRGYIENLTTDEKKEWPMNPSVVSENISADWKERDTFSGSGSFLDFDSSKALKFNMQFYVSVNQIMKSKKRKEVEAQADVIDFRNFLHSLTIPDKGFIDQGTVGAQPPTILVIWPELFARRAVLNSVRFNYQVLKFTGGIKVYTADCSFTQKRDFRVWSEDIRLLGRMY